MSTAICHRQYGTAWQQRLAVAMTAVPCCVWPCYYLEYCMSMHAQGTDPSGYNAAAAVAGD